MPYNIVINMFIPAVYKILITSYLTKSRVTYFYNIRITVRRKTGSLYTFLREKQ